MIRPACLRMDGPVMSSKDTLIVIPAKAGTQEVYGWHRFEPLASRVRQYDEVRI